MKTTARVLLLVGVLATAAWPSQLILRAGLFDPQLGAQVGPGNPEFGAAPMFLGVKVLDVALGAKATDRLYWALGTTLMTGRLIDTAAPLTLNGWLFWDAAPAAPSRRAFAYTRATFVWADQNGWNGEEARYFPTIHAGIGYTWYALTPYFEAGYNGGVRMFTAAAGVTLGGNYILGR